MICNLQNITVMTASYGNALLCSVDRQGNELTILKEKKSDETYRKYYCSNCAKYFAGEEPTDWQPVVDHFGSKGWSDIDESEIIDLDDPNMRPSIKKQLQTVIEVFGNG